eukprot:2740702-Pleurochrysis_carterae.AAC.8
MRRRLGRAAARSREASVEVTRRQRASVCEGHHTRILEWRYQRVCLQACEGGGYMLGYVHGNVYRNVYGNADPVVYGNLYGSIYEMSTEMPDELRRASNLREELSEVLARGHVESVKGVVEHEQLGRRAERAHQEDLRARWRAGG